MGSDGTPTVPYGSGLAAWRESGGFGDRFNLLAQSDFLFNVLEDDFRGDALRAWYPGSKTNGASAAVTFTEHNTSGYIDLITGVDNLGYAGQGVGTSWNGDRGMLAEFLVRTPSSLADYKLEIGCSDADDLAGAVDVKDSPTVNMTDGAVLVFDTNDDSNVTLVHSKGGTPAAVDLNMVLAVSSLYYVSFRIIGDDLKATIMGLEGTRSAPEQVANAVAAAGLEGGTDLTPWVFTQTRAGSASKTTRWYKWRVTEPAY